MKNVVGMKMEIFPSNIRVLYYHFSPDEVLALYRLIHYMGWIPHDDEEMIRVINHVCEIVKQNGMATGNNQTT
jgi:hypothetical protein